MRRRVTCGLRDDQGQDVVEYALLASFISIAAVLTISAIGPLLSGLYTKIASAFIGG